MLRAYFVEENDDGEGGALVATNCRQARNIYFNKYNFSGEFLDLRVRWLRNVDVSGMVVGQLFDSVEGLKRGAYGTVEGEDCPECGALDTTLYIDGGKVGCAKCLELE
jgi:hypothetical protein